MLCLVPSEPMLAPSDLYFPFSDLQALGLLLSEICKQRTAPSQSPREKSVNAWVAEGSSMKEVSFKEDFNTVLGRRQRVMTTQASVRTTETVRLSASTETVSQKAWAKYNLRQAGEKASSSCWAASLIRKVNHSWAPAKSLTLNILKHTYKIKQSKEVTPMQRTVVRMASLVPPKIHLMTNPLLELCVMDNFVAKDYCATFSHFSSRKMYR